MSFIGHTSLLSVAFSRCRYPGSWVPFAAFYSELRGGGRGGAIGRRYHVKRYYIRHFIRFIAAGTDQGVLLNSASAASVRANVIYCGNVRVTYSAYVRLYVCLHLYRSYIEIIRMRHVSVASFHFDKKRFADCNSDTSRLIIGIARLQKGCPNATVQISFSFVTG